MSWKAVGFKNEKDCSILDMNPKVFEDNGQIGVKDIFGKIIVPALYNYIEKNVVGGQIIFIVSINKKYGVHDSYGKLIIPVEYSKLHLGDNFVIAEKIGVSDVYNYQGDKILSSTVYKYIKYNDEIIVQGTVNGGWKVYDKNAQEIEPGVIYEDIFMHEEFLCVKLNGVWKVLYSS